MDYIYNEKDAELIKTFVETFGMLAEVPRKSKHEEAISDKIKAWATEHGFIVKQNEAYDLIIDVPATEGMEERPLIALQAHMDMVCVARDGIDYDPLNDPISVVIDEKNKTMTADGTSLGADDGAGVVIMMMIAENLIPHGRLRMILTTDEEDGMSGANAIKKEDLSGVKYLINIDSEESDTVTVSSAGGNRVIVTTSCEKALPTKSSSVKITLSGLRGGHSGMEIDKGRCNACILLADVLKNLGDTVEYELASVKGGTADNAIPSTAEAVIFIAPEERDKLNTYIETAKKDYQEKYKDTDGDAEFTISDCDKASFVLTETQAENVISYITEAFDGVYSISEEVGGLVESSSNLGQVRVGTEKTEIRHLTRSSSIKKRDEIIDKLTALAEEKGFEADVREDAKTWPVKEDGKLAPAIRSAYKEVTDEDMITEAIHAGLECGTFFELCPDIDMVSIGPDLKHVHTPDEILYLGSIPITWHLLEKVLVSL